MLHGLFGTFFIQIDQFGEAVVKLPKDAAVYIIVNYLFSLR